jgi:signal transduction histidine kinase
MRGRIEARSVEGQGSSFIMTLPAAESVHLK